MNQHSLKNVVAENVNALKAEHGNNLKMSKHKKMCWKCQKDKVFENGAALTFIGNLSRFICLECNQPKLKEIKI